MDWEIKGHIESKNGKLVVGGVDAASLAEKYGTPLYVYDAGLILQNYRNLRDEFAKAADRNVRILYAVKANSSLAILKLLAGEGCHADVVSPNEARMALDAGFPVESILFTGTSVSDDVLDSLIELSISMNVDSFSQMRRLAKRGSFPVHIRWNPGQGIGHHEHVITAGKLVKFGIPEEKIVDAFLEARDLGLDPIGLHQHIGSGLLEDEVDTYLGTVDKTLKVTADITNALGRDLDYIDFGGGLGIPYMPGEKALPLDRFAKGICDRVKESGLNVGTIAIEPGRYLVGDAGILLAKINTVEEKGLPLIGVDAGFTSLIRPAMYAAYHEIVICEKADAPSEKEWLVAGNLCESADVFNPSKTPRPLPTPDEGDILAILDAGAYGFSMASTYNANALPAEVLIEDGKPRLIRERQTYDDLTKGQMA